MSSGLPRSIQTRLVRHAHAQGLDPTHVLTRYATERLLYRLGRSPYADRFVLKGALLLLAWLGEGTRPTRDADLLGFGPLEEADILRIFEDLCRLDVEPDGLLFDPATIRVSSIREEDVYGGQRILVTAGLGPARLRVQVDVGIGDAVEPEPTWLDYPSLLELPSPHIRAYQPYTVVAEKLHAMVVLAQRNSRLRDFFDVHALSHGKTFDGATLARSIASTFARRDTALPSETPIALPTEFAAIEGKTAQWRAFCRRSRLEPAPQLAAVITHNAAFVGPVLDALAAGRAFAGTWAPSGPWQAVMTGDMERGS